MRVLSALLVFALISSLSSLGLAETKQPQPPVAPKKEYHFDFHGKQIDDPYFWLKDKKNPEVIQYIERENAYREALTAPLKPFENKLFQEMLSHIKQTDLEVPVLDKGYLYYSRTEEGKQYPLYCRKKTSLQNPEEILLDVNQMAEGKKFLSVFPLGVSDDGNYYAYNTDTTGFREYFLSIKDLKTGKLVENKFVKAAGFSWASDHQTIFYVTEDAAKRAYRLYRHVIGEPKEKDVLVYEEKDELYRLGIRRTSDKKYLVHFSASSTTTEESILKTDNPAGQFVCFAPRQVGVEYSVDHRDQLFHIRTNKNGAVNYNWMTCGEENRGPESWKEFEPYQESVFLEGIKLFKDFAVISERSSGLPRLRVYSFASKDSYQITFPEPSYTVRMGSNPDFNTSSIRFNYTSLVTPPSVYEFNLSNRERKLLKKTEVPGGFQEENYVTERIEATAPDGVKVPISIVYRKGLVRDGKAPMLLYGYGSYGITTEPTFVPSRLPLLDRGVVFAMAHIRGSSDLGRKWYLDGKLMKKMNTFTDFIACADHLVHQKYGSRDRLAIEGRSAGGLLVGAVINLRPDLCKFAHLGVPFVDVVSTMLDESLPLTIQEFLEWGNPKESTAGNYMLQYSPYDNLARKNYPTILVTTSLNDSQVLFHEPTKYVAKLRTLKTDSNPILLKCNMDAGHGGASGRYEALKERAYESAIILNALGIKE